MLTALATALLSLGLTASPLAPTRSPQVAQDEAAREDRLGGREERLELFRQLVAAIRARHAFSEQTEKNLGRAWSDYLPALEREFAEASAPEQLSAAVWHLQNSLHDRHCYFHASEPGQWLTLGFEADVEWVEGKPVFYVASVADPELASVVSPGDLITELDGVPASELVARFELVSNANNPRGVASDVARYLSARFSALGGVREGEQVRVRFSSRAGGRAVSKFLVWRRPQPRPASSSPNGPIDYQSSACSSLPEPDYGPYTLRDSGIHWCLYASTQPPYDAYPVVRHFSFNYTTGPDPAGHLLRTERRWLERALGALTSAKAVILDLRDNTGGNDSAWFLDWWAPRSYANHFIDYVLYEDFDQFRRARPVGFSGRDFDLYRKAHESRAPGQRFWRRQPFFGRPEGCSPDQRCVPGHRVTALPVALLVGPRCMSACDGFAQVFRENRFGPLVGEPPSAAYSLRAELPVRMPQSGKWLGTMHLAYTREQSGVTGEYLEGRLLELDRLIERTFENRERYGLLLIDAAIEALAGPPWAGEASRSGDDRPVSR